MREEADLPGLDTGVAGRQPTGSTELHEPSADPLPPPRVGVVLAAGRSERLSEVTGGGSKALVPLGGLRLVERAVRTLVALGMDRVVVVVGYHAGPVAAVSRRTAPGRVQVVEALDWQSGNGASLASAEAAVGGEDSILTISVDHLFSEDALGGLSKAGEPAILVDPTPGPEVWPEATKVRLASDGRIVELDKDLDSPVADCGALLLPPEIFEAHRRAATRGDSSLSGAVNVLASRRRLAAIPLRSGDWWQDIDTPADLARAGRLLRASLPRAEDGPVARLLNRRISVPVSWILARLRPNPDLLSALAFVVGLAGAILLGSGHGLAGGVLAQACSILDGVDGEVARLSLRAGPRGTLLDGILDRLGDAALCAGLGAWAIGEGEAPTAVVILVAASTAGAMLSMATKDRVAALGLEPPSERRLGWLLGGRDGRLFRIAVLSILGLPLAALAATAATSFAAAGLRVAFARHPPP
jgi:1L-myo-inositol 1-phosphate cytidylyltransferase / CDP-L-myo-inositol myo-inositolphosphotransferase